MAEATSDDLLHSWSLQRYARRKASSSRNEDGLRRITRSKSIVANDDNGDQWTVHASSEADKLSLILTRASQQQQQLVVLKGNLIMESIFFVNVQKSCKAIAKGDSILFLYMASGFQGGTRQFRVKFEASENESGTERCQNFVRRSQHLVRFTGELFQGANNSSNNLAEERTTDVAQAILGRKQHALPECYTECTDGLEDVVAFCLADPTFPAFVDSVEKCLSSLTTAHAGATREA